MRAFTLIELLVVITIIVVLLSMLTPALDRAIYQAELAVCAANQDAIAGAVVVYAAGHRRMYPYRVGVPSGGGARDNGGWNMGRLQLGLTHNGGAKNPER